MVPLRMHLYVISSTLRGIDRASVVDLATSAPNQRIPPLPEGLTSLFGVQTPWHVHYDPLADAQLTFTLYLKFQEHRAAALANATLNVVKGRFPTPPPVSHLPLL
jgi:hypothetical protein